jgi:hypothetical protein
MEEGSIILRMVTLIWASGKMINSMGKESICSQMVISIKGNSSMEENKVEESINIKQGQCMMENGSKIRNPDSECTII